MMRFAFGLLIALSTLVHLPGPALADMSVAEAQQKGLIGVTTEGLLAPVESSVPRDVQQLVVEANRERVEKYRDIAREAVAEAEANGEQLSFEKALKAVQRRAAARLRAQLPPGQYFQNAAGQWQQK